MANIVLIKPAKDEAKEVKREPISKKLRFTIFKRDAFTCQYCGRTPPAVVLELDHVIPVASGGKNKSDNLLTACFDCNRGKGASLLSAIPESLERRAELMKERQDQITAYTKLLRSIEKQQAALIDRIESVFTGYFPRREFTTSFRDSIKINFIPKLAEDQLLLAITKACIKRPSESSAAVKYFCGICWHMIKGTYS